MQQVRIVTSELELEQLAKENGKTGKKPETSRSQTSNSASHTANDHITEADFDSDEEHDGDSHGDTHTNVGADAASNGKPDNQLTEEERAKRERNREKRKRKQILSRAEATAVYITKLPLDVTEEEVETFFRRAGAIRVDDVGRPRVQLYRDEHGQLKGDGVVKYVKPESVDIAIEMLNDGYLRPNWPISVEHAKFKATEDFTVTRDAKKVRKMQLAQKQAEAAEEGIELKKGLRMVVIKHFCSMAEAENAGDVDSYSAEMCAELRDECERVCGPVDKISAYPLHPLGPALILFKSTVGAQKCIELMDKRFFSGRRLVCEFHDGTQYAPKETEEDEEMRLDAFGDWLEGK